MDQLPSTVQFNSREIGWFIEPYGFILIGWNPWILKIMIKGDSGDFPIILIMNCAEKVDFEQKFARSEIWKYFENFSESSLSMDFYGIW